MPIRSLQPPPTRPVDAAADRPCQAMLEHTEPRRGRRTREETDRKIIRATLEIAATQGIGAVTIEEVARRSGVAKTTIYRRYSNTADMLHKIQVMDITYPSQTDDLVPTRPNLQLLLEHIVERFSSDIGIKAVGMALSSDSTYFDRIVNRAIQPVRDRLAAFLMRGVRAGIFHKTLDANFLFNTILGSMVACEALPDNDRRSGWAKQMTALIWSAIAR